MRRRCSGACDIGHIDGSAELKDAAGLQMPVQLDRGWDLGGGTVSGQRIHEWITIGLRGEFSR